MTLDLDHQAGLDPAKVGAKAAWLAMARRAGLAVLPGLVVPGAVSSHHMKLGAEALAARGSGGARLAITGEPIEFADDLVENAARLGDNLVARSSTALEGSGEWSGAFASYLHLSPAELPKAVVGCWASAFSVAALERQDSASIEPGSFTMAVLIQPALDPEAGGTARLDEAGTVVVHGVKGSPAPLLQGWSGGHEARSGGEGWIGDDLIELVGRPALDDIAGQLARANEMLGVNQCEWALDGSIWLLQLDARLLPAVRVSSPTTGSAVDPRLIPVTRLVIQAPGRLWQELVIPWALAGLPPRDQPVSSGPADTPELARELGDQILSEVWGMPASDAISAARRCIAGLLGPDPGPALDQIDRLAPADPILANRLLGLVQALQAGEERPPRMGIGRWEPFVASVTLASGTHHQGTAASAGLGAGFLCRIDQTQGIRSHPPRRVIASNQPVPGLAPLLWDAAGVITATGSPAAHLFESARALGIPAVCGVELDESHQIVAIDGHTGLVATMSANGDEDV